MRTTRGQLPLLVFACGRAMISVGHQPGDMLALMGTEPNSGRYLRFKLPVALGTNDYLPIGTPMFRFDEELDLITFPCGGPLMDYFAKTVQYAAGQKLPRPRLDRGLLLPGSVAVIVGGIVSGAQLRARLTRNGTVVDWTEACGDTPCTAFVPAPLGALIPGDILEFEQELCDGTLSTTEKGVVADCSAMPLPSLVQLPRFGDTSTTLEHAPPGSLNVVLVGDGFGPRDNLRVVGASEGSSVVGFVRPLAKPDAWLVVAQPSAVCPAPLGADYGIVP